MRKKTHKSGIDQKPNLKPIFVLIGSSLFLLFLIFSAISFFKPKNQTDTPISIVNQYPQQFRGNAIEIEGDITNRIGYRALTVRARGLFEDEILVISQNPLEEVGGSGESYELFADNKPVKVSGRVQLLNISEVEDQIGFDLNDSELSEWIGKPVIVANTISNSN